MCHLGSDELAGSRSRDPQGPGQLRHCDWAAERTSFPREIAELCLAHFVGNAVERAYRRSDLFDKRRDLMERWARFCCPASADVIEIRGRG